MMVKQDTKFLRTLAHKSVATSFQDRENTALLLKKTGAQKKQVHIEKKNYNKLLHFVTSPAQHHKVIP